MNIQNIMSFMQQVRNPQQVLKRMGVPEEHMSSPQNVAQWLLDSGKVTQQQINQASSMYRQLFGK